jgi:hypothetical protein
MNGTKVAQFVSIGKFDAPHLACRTGIVIGRARVFVGAGVRMSHVSDMEPLARADEVID